VNCDVMYEELAALAAGELPAERAGQVCAHLPGCPRCRRRVEALGQADAALAALRPQSPPSRAMLAVRRELAAVLRPPRPAEVMTLEEVAAFCRLTPDQLADVVEDLPAFELAGQVRVLRRRLIEWLEQRQRDYSYHLGASWAARAVAADTGKDRDHETF
jgi:anti-sigma factor RsiW